MGMNLSVNERLNLFVSAGGLNQNLTLAGYSLQRSGREGPRVDRGVRPYSHVGRSLQYSLGASRTSLIALIVSEVLSSESTGALNSVEARSFPNSLASWGVSG
jgi:hypothetical protein